MTLDDCTEIGTVEVLIERVYDIDPNAPSSGTSAVVEPGTYPLYEYGEARFWLMDGYLNLGFAKAGDGMFVMPVGGGDVKSSVPVRFPSRSFGPEQWADLLAHETCQPGPAQRLKVSIKED